MPAASKRGASEHIKKQTRSKTREAATETPDLPPSSPLQEMETSSPLVAVSAIHALSDIPGLGPIRVRALEKAGLGNLSVLRAASREQLMAVPGMSTIKAEQIQAFLANASFTGPEETVDKLAAPSRPARSPRNASVPVSSDSEMTPSALIAPVSAWDQESSGICVDLITLLVSPPAPDFRARLLRELVRFAAGMPAWQKGLAEVGDEAQERALRRVRRLKEALTEALVSPDLDRKTQSRLAEELADASDRLYTLSGQTEPLRKGEDSHD